MARTTRLEGGNGQTAISIPPKVHRGGNRFTQGQGGQDAAVESVGMFMSAAQARFLSRSMADPDEVGDL